MRLRLLLLASAALAVALPACADEDGTAVGTVDPPPLDGQQAETPAAAPPAVCAAIDALERAVDDLNAESAAQWRARAAVVRDGFERVEDIAGADYAAAVEAFEARLVDFETAVDELGEDPKSAPLAVADTAAELEVAGDELNEAVDCP